LRGTEKRKSRARVHAKLRKKEGGEGSVSSAQSDKGDSKVEGRGIRKRNCILKVRGGQHEEGQ